MLDLTSSPLYQLSDPESLKKKKIGKLKSVSCSDK